MFGRLLSRKYVPATLLNKTFLNYKIQLFKRQFYLCNSDEVPLKVKFGDSPIRYPGKRKRPKPILSDSEEESDPR